METFTKTFRDLSKNKLPKWSVTMPKATSIDIYFEQKVSDKKIVYFPSCITRSMGLNDVSKEEKQLFDVAVELLSSKSWLPNIIPSKFTKFMLWYAFFFKRI
ncbi:MAG: hypothetical protein U5K55_08875 [Aliarcobacter sp.]|nr:hypothetical protein [Aliarcobacter sp.]